MSANLNSRTYLGNRLRRATFTTYPGQYYDAETDLFQNWNRFYDANTGRYLEPEPLWLYPEKLVPIAAKGRSTPVYAYAGNNPVNNTDIDGRLIAITPGDSATDLNSFVDDAYNDANNPAHEAVVNALMSPTTVTLEGGHDLPGGLLAQTGPTTNGECSSFVNKIYWTAGQHLIFQEASEVPWIRYDKQY